MKGLRLKCAMSIAITSLISGCVSPPPSVSYQNGLDQVYWQSGEYSVAVTGDFNSQLNLSPRDHESGSSESFFDLIQLDSGMVLDVTGEAYLAYSFTSDTVDHVVQNVSGIWMGGTEERLMVVIKNNGCEAYLHDLRLFNEPNVSGCGVKLSFKAK